MTNTNTPPVYLLCFGDLGRLTETVIPARIKQLLHIIQFPNDAYILKRKCGKEGQVETWMLSRNSFLEVDWHAAKQTESLMNRLLFSRKEPVIICVVDPSDFRARERAEKNLGVLKRAGLKILGIFLDDGSEDAAEVPKRLLETCIGYTQIRLDGHAEDWQARKRTALACVRQVELLYHLSTYPDSEPSFLRMLPLLLKDCPQFVLAAGFAEGNLCVAGERLSSKLNVSLQKPVHGRSLVMVLSNKQHLGHHEISIVHSTCSTLLGRRMVIKAGGNQHPHLRKGQYLLIGMVSAPKVHSRG